MRPLPNNFNLGNLKQLPATVVLSTLFLFFMLNLVRGTAIDLYFGLSEDRTPEAEQALAQQLGIDKPLPQQYLTWLGKVAQGDLGESWRFKLPVWELIATRLPMRG